MSAKIILMRGLPGSGKSTRARELQKKIKDSVIVSRDDIRFMMFGRYTGVDEDTVTEVETSSVRAGLREGKTVIVDAMHLLQRYVI